MAEKNIKVPDVGEGVAQVELVEWHVKPGDMVREDDVIAAVMTDKATVEIPSIFEGTIVSLGGEIGDTIAVGSVLVVIETSGGSGAAAGAAATPEAKPEAPPETPEASPAKPAPAPERTADRTPDRAAPPAGTARPLRAEGEAPLAAPAVRARARAAGIDLRQVAGTGPAGRITAADLDRVFEAGPGSAAAAPSRGRRREGTSTLRVIGLRRKIADRMSLANSRIPHITVVEEVDVTALEDLRAAMNAARGDRPKVTMLPFISAGLCRALADHPGMNAHFDDDAGIVTRYNPVHIGIATMTDSGLVVPVLRHAEALGIRATAAEIARLAEAARSGKASRDELTGSTITITSLGPLGAIATTPIINHPEVAILGVNKMAVRPMWDGHQFVPRKMMNISASFDHRVVDGWDAAAFVQGVKQLLETPALIFMEDEA
ncbi:dihydrolipoamide acetyltransferase family protein [Frigidibacter oleivorans]|uniref:dihydrolipoamide acetyltransferase family protein n=1 Tax=Frigidibacter oleivorans TaxID=2487129 RepID=UPI000F8E189B|nr:dihydrolipoamide acetyltransferase family protein [Frigidibacter oleivorans]